MQMRNRRAIMRQYLAWLIPMTIQVLGALMPGIVDRPSFPGRQKYGKWLVRRTEIGTSGPPNNYAAIAANPYPQRAGDHRWTPIAQSRCAQGYRCKGDVRLGMSTPGPVMRWVRSQRHTERLRKAPRLSAGAGGIRNMRGGYSAERAGAGRPRG